MRTIPAQTIRRLLASSLMICVGTSAAQCEKYDDAATQLSGKVRIETFFGPPNYGESPKTDAKEQQAVLYLTKPLCTDASGDGPAERNQLKITLAPMGQFSLRPFAGKSVLVRGSLFHANTGHHHTQILISIDQPPTVLKQLGTQ